MSNFTIEQQKAISVLLETVGVSSSTSTTTGAPTPELDAFLQAIPYANDGDVITPDHHNSLRDAIAAIARGLDASQFAKLVTRSFIPVLQPIDGQPPFRITEGKTVGPSGDNQNTDGAGWMPLDLPDGTDIYSLRLRVSAPKPTPSFWSAIVRRQPLLADKDPDDIVGGEFQKDFPAQGGTLLKEFTSAPGDQPPVSVAGELRHVDNSTYRYFFSTLLTSTDPAAVELTLIQVICTRG